MEQIIAYFHDKKYKTINITSEINNTDKLCEYENYAKNVMMYCERNVQTEFLFTQYQCIDKDNIMIIINNNVIPLCVQIFDKQIVVPSNSFDKQLERILDNFINNKMICDVCFTEDLHELINCSECCINMCHECINQMYEQNDEPKCPKCRQIKLYNPLLKCQKCNKDWIKQIICECGYVICNNCVINTYAIEYNEIKRIRCEQCKFMIEIMSDDD